MNEKIISSLIDEIIQKIEVRPVITAATATSSSTSTSTSLKKETRGRKPNPDKSKKMKKKLIIVLNVSLVRTNDCYSKNIL